MSLHTAACSIYIFIFTAHHFRCHSVAPPLCRGFLKGCFAETPVNKTIEDSDDPHSCLPCSKSRCVMWVLRLRGDAAPGQKWEKTDSEVVGRTDGWGRGKKKKKEKKKEGQSSICCLSFTVCLQNAPGRLPPRCITILNSPENGILTSRWRLLLLKSERGVFLKHASSSHWCMAFLKRRCKG